MRPTRRFLCGLLLVLPGASARAAASGDEWLGRDKAKHFAVCTVLAGAGYGGRALLFEAPSARWIAGAGLAMGAGLGKELYDTRSGGSGFSVKDLTWDAVGTATGLGVAYLVDRFVLGRDVPESRGEALSGVPGGRESPGLGVSLVPGGFGRRGLATGLPLAPAGQADAPVERLRDVGARVLEGRGLLTARPALDEPHQLLALEPRLHQHHAATPAVAAGDEHGDAAARTLVHAAGGQDADLLGQAALREGPLQPVRQIQSAAPRAAAHEALAADEDLHLARSLPRVVPHPSSVTSRFHADAPLRIR